MLDRGVGRVDDGVGRTSELCISFSGLDFGIIFEYSSCKKCTFLEIVKLAKMWVGFLVSSIYIDFQKTVFDQK